MTISGYIFFGIFSIIILFYRIIIMKERCKL